MPKNTIKRRKLDFKNFSDLKNDLELLSKHPYQRAGNWSLAQVCDHLTIILSKCMDGFNITLPWYARVFGKFAKVMTSTFRFIPAGVKAPTELMPLDTSNDAEAGRKLQQTIERYETFTQPLHPSPLFGKMTRNQWDQAHLIHAAHHFSFLIPTK